VLCLAIGVATIAAVVIPAEAVRESSRRDARELLVGDLELGSPNLALAPLELRRLLGTAARLSTTVRTTAFVTAPTAGGSASL